MSDKICPGQCGLKTGEARTTGGSILSETPSLADAYQPILRGYFFVAALYYAAMILAHGATLDGNSRLWMVGVSLAGLLLCGGCAHYLKQPRALSALEAAAALVNLIIVVNVMTGIHVEYEQAKLVYFIMMTMIFAFACASLRQAILSILITFACLYHQLTAHAPDQLKTYGFVGFASAMASIGITHFLRRTLAVALTARQQAEERLHRAQSLSEEMRQKSLTDSLTGLPNRRAFFEALDRRETSPSDAGGFWLILLDLDGFKAVNDNHGHFMGDALLRAVAQRLNDYAGKEMHVSRIGGDEFNIIARQPFAQSEIQLWCEALLTHLAKPYIIDGRRIIISASIGCCASNSETEGSEIGLTQMADYALLQAKRAGRNCVTMFLEKHARDAHDRFRIEQALRAADLSAEMELVFQPQFNLRTRHISGAEALVRWHSPSLGAMAPGQFIVIAEECGLIGQITMVVLKKALAALGQATMPIPVAINLSGNDLLSDAMIDEIIGEVRASGVDPALIEFEITETAMMPDIGRASANVAKLASNGHAIALDDFGTGYSNFQYLRTLSITKLKVDRAFMEDAGDLMTEKLLRSVAGMARTLGVLCLFEGVESELEMLLAKRTGAQIVQGYLIGKPMRWPELEQLVSHYLQEPAKTERLSAKIVTN